MITQIKNKNVGDLPDMKVRSKALAKRIEQKKEKMETNPFNEKRKKRTWIIPAQRKIMKFDENKPLSPSVSTADMGTSLLSEVASDIPTNEDTPFSSVTTTTSTNKDTPTASTSISPSPILN